MPLLETQTDSNMSLSGCRGASSSWRCRCSDIPNITRKCRVFVKSVLQIAYLDEGPSTKKDGEARLFSSLIDGRSELDEKTGKRKPKFRIEFPVSGNPVLGDGKSDNLVAFANRHFGHLETSVVMPLSKANGLRRLSDPQEPCFYN